MRHRIAEGWEEFYVTVLLPAGVPRSGAQFTETRRAFYQGAVAAFGTITKSMAPEPTPTDLTVMDDLLAEFEGFRAGLVAGEM